MNIKAAYFRAHIDVLSVCSCPQLPSLAMSRGRSMEERKLLSVSSPGFTGWPPAEYGDEIPATELSPPTAVCFAGIWLCWRDGRQMELVWEEKKIGLVKWNMNRRPAPVRRRFSEERRETLFIFATSSIWKTAHFEGEGNIRSKKQCWIE